MGRHFIHIVVVIAFVYICYYDYYIPLQPFDHQIVITSTSDTIRFQSTEAINVSRIEKLLDERGLPDTSSYTIK